VVKPNPLVSRGKRTVGWSPARFADTRYVNDGDRTTAWCAGKPAPGRPAWVAIDLGRGPTRILAAWTAAGSFDYEETDYGSPGAYRLEVSPDSTDGTDGSWSPAASVDSVITHAAAHAVDFAGMRWLRLVVTAAPAQSPNGVQIDELEVFDASLAVSDSWFFMGDSITAFAFGRDVHQGLDFASCVHARHPLYFPAVINGGMGGETSADGVRHLADRLRRNPEARLWGVAYGTNDAAGNASDTTAFRANVSGIVEGLRAAGRVPILATIPFAADGQHQNIPRFNQTLEDVRQAAHLAKGPDLYAWFAAHPDELRDGVHPDARGVANINRLWADAVDGLYGHGP
jgi:lysophospholipase L1-like esterase